MIGSASAIFRIVCETGYRPISTCVLTELQQAVVCLSSFLRKGSSKDKTALEPLKLSAKPQRILVAQWYPFALFLVWVSYLKTTKRQHEHSSWNWFPDVRARHEDSIKRNSTQSPVSMQVMGPVPLPAWN